MGMSKKQWIFMCDVAGNEFFAARVRVSQEYAKTILLRNKMRRSAKLLTKNQIKFRLKIIANAKYAREHNYSQRDAERELDENVELVRIKNREKIKQAIRKNKR